MLRSFLRLPRNKSLSRIISSSVCLTQPSFRQKRCSSSAIPDDDDAEKISFLYDLPSHFLRDSDLNNFDETTFQRKNVPFDIKTGKPELKKRVLPKKSVSIDECIIVGSNQCKISWSDGISSHHDINAVKQRYWSWKRCRPEDRTLWKGLTEEDVRLSSDLSISFESLVSEDGSGMSKAIKTIYQYGILLVTNTPVDDNGVGIAALGASLSGGSVKDRPSSSILANYRLGGTEVVLPDATDGPLRTLFGGVWATTSAGQPSGTSVADSAYGNDGLPLHTDMTYLEDPPGLQIFTMVQPAVAGGESVFCDGFAVADALRMNDPTAFEILSKTPRIYHSQDRVTGWNLRATGPVIEVRDGRLIRIRHNDLDRLPDLPPCSVTERAQMDEFYEDLESAHEKWDALLAHDKFRLVMKLGRGDTMVVANQVREIFFKITLP